MCHPIEPPEDARCKTLPPLVFSVVNLPFLLYAFSDRFFWGLVINAPIALICLAIYYLRPNLNQSYKNLLTVSSLTTFVTCFLLGISSVIKSSLNLPNSKNDLVLIDIFALIIWPLLLTALLFLRPCHLQGPENPQHAVDTPEHPGQRDQCINPMMVALMERKQNPKKQEEGSPGSADAV